MTALGLTKARSLGPLAEAVERAGGSAQRAFRRAGLPLRLVDEPEQLILLRDQMRLLESAAREIGDDVLPARLSIEAGALGLGRLGALCCGQPSLGAAIACSNASVAATLQSSSEHGLEIRDGWARWTYALTGPEREGRQKNEMLCLGYRLDLMRLFLGRRWTPCHVTLAGGILDGRRALAEVLGCAVALGPAMALVFPAALLEAPHPHLARGATFGDDGAIPDGDDLPRLAEAMIALDLLDGLPSLGRLARRLGLSSRDLQRRLAARDATFQALRQRVQARRATGWLLDPQRSVTAIAQDLGYPDPAHFTRAFRSWTGQSPRAWRKRWG